jgi:hypothetical protein
VKVVPLSVERHNPELLATYSVVLDSEPEAFGSIAIVLTYVLARSSPPRGLLQLNPPSNDR